MAAAFDDVKVAQLLATALALDGQASDRLATIFNTIAPDADRKRRVLTLTRSMLTETDFGRCGPVPGALDVDGGAARLVQRQAVRVRSLPRVARRRRRTRRADGRGGPPARAARLDGDPRAGQRAHAVGHAADRSADARARRAAGGRHRRRHGGAGRGPADVRRLRRCAHGHPGAGRNEVAARDGARPRRVSARARSAGRVARDARHRGTARRRRRAGVGDDSGDRGGHRADVDRRAQAGRDGRGRERRVVARCRV